MAVGKVLGGVGAGAVLIGAIMAVVISIIQEWVVVQLPPDEVCTTTPLGKLGLYHAYFDPACVNTPGANYSQQLVSLLGSRSRVESSTTEFSPLFPSTTKFGGALGSLPLPDFTTCEEFYNSSQTQASLAAFTGAALVAPAFAKVNATLETYTVAYETQVGALTSVVKGLWSSLLIGGVNGSFPQLQAAIDGIILTEAGLIQVIQGAYNKTFLSIPDISRTTLNSSLTIGASVDLSQLSAILNGLSFNPIFTAANVGAIAYANIVGNLNTTTIGLAIATSKGVADPTNVIKAVGGAQGFASAMKASDPSVAVIHFNSTTSFTTLQRVLESAATSGVAALTPFNSNFYAARGLLYVCSALLSATTPAACAAAYNGKPLQENLNAPSPLCTALQVKEATSAAVFNFTTGCSDIDLLNSTAVAAIIPQTYLPIVIGLKPLLTQCAQGSVPLSVCLFGVASQRDVPQDFTTRPPLCTALPLQVPALAAAPCNNFLQLLTAAGSTLTGSAASDLAQFTQLIGLCVTSGKTTLATCQPFLAQALRFKGTSQVLSLAGDNVTAQIASCNDDLEDARRIKLAQVLVPIGTALDFVAVGLAVVLVLKSNMVVGLASGVLAIVGGVLVLVALLAVINAPVYQSVGLPPVDEKPQYVSGVAKPLGYIAILAPLLGGIVLCIAAVLSRNAGSSESTEVTSKVENAEA